MFFFFLMIRRPPRSTQSRSSAASDVYKRQIYHIETEDLWQQALIGAGCSPIDRTLVRSRSFLYTMDRHPAALGGTAIPLPAKGGTHNGLDYRSCSHCSRRRVARWHLQPAHPQAHHEGRSLVGHGRPAEAPL